MIDERQEVHRDQKMRYRIHLLCHPHPAGLGPCRLCISSFLVLVHSKQACVHAIVILQGLNRQVPDVMHMLSGSVFGGAVGPRGSS